MKLGRRSLLKLAVGASQMSLLESMAPLRAFAAPGDKPTKLLAVYIGGGISHHEMWTAFNKTKVSQFIPPPVGGGTPLFYNAAMVGNYDGSSDEGGPFARVRGPIWWNPADPLDRRQNPASPTQSFIGHGYSWVSKSLGNTQAVYERACMIHGVDQGTATHLSGLIGSLCGVSGGEFRAPAIAAVIANAMMRAFPDRPIPSVAIGGVRPKALSTTAHPINTAANAVMIDSVPGLEQAMSDRTLEAWAGLKTRREVDELDFAGASTGGKLRTTFV